MLTFVDVQIWSWRGSVVELSMKAKPATTFRDCFSTFVSVKPLDVFKETWGQLLAMFVVSSVGVFGQNIHLQ